MVVSLIESNTDCDPKFIEDGIFGVKNDGMSVFIGFDFTIKSNCL
jgi:hypothetical protein